MQLKDVSKPAHHNLHYISAKVTCRNPVVESPEKKLDPPIALANALSILPEMDEQSLSEHQRKHQSVTARFQGRWNFVPSLLLSNTMSLAPKIDEGHFQEDDI